MNGGRKQKTLFILVEQHWKVSLVKRQKVKLSGEDHCTNT